MRLKRLTAGLSPYGFIAPAIILICIFGFIPLILAVYVSLFKFPLVNPAMRQFIGLKNYIDLFQDTGLRTAFLNTVFYTVLLVPTQCVLALILALLIEKPLRGIGLFRTLFYVPVVISMVVASTIWKVMIDSQSGIINSVLAWLGLPRLAFLSSVQQALPTIAAILSWKWAGFSMIILLAGLHAIPGQLYEVAELDGASGWQTFWHVTLPLLRGPAVYVLVTNLINAAKLFTPVYIMTQGGPQESTSVMVFYIYQQAFTFGQLGYATAIAVVFTVFLVLISITQLRILRRAEIN
ncbi:MAG: sugar ABC transporter permease [Anaerolineaceae bacterium]|nr:sugar ABC transporter permease [Anaerolineaceae bacterium]